MSQEKMIRIQAIGLKSISDDDVCSDCNECKLQPNGLSACAMGWPGRESPDGYIVDCTEFENRAKED